MPSPTNDIPFLASLLFAFKINERKKLQYHKDLQQVRENQQNQLIEAAVRSEELERHRIAEALHDEVGAILSSAKLHLFGIKAHLLDEKDNRLHEKGKELLDEAVQKVRGISHNLHSSILQEFGLNEAISHFMKMTITGGIIECRLKLDENYTTQNTDNDISIYRLLQELINNIIKHAKPSVMMVSSQLSINTLQILVQHNGNGISQIDFETLRYSKDGLGLKNIQNRVILLKGNIAFAKDDFGFRIDFNVPVNLA